VGSLHRAAYRLGVRLGHYQLVQWGVVGLGWTAKVVRWSVIAIGVVVVIALVALLAEQLNYAPLWFRVYDNCMKAQPEAASFTEGARQVSACMDAASRRIEERKKSDRALGR
jgi:hypothetical protein